MFSNMDTDWIVMWLKLRIIDFSQEQVVEKVPEMYCVDDGCARHLNLPHVNLEVRNIIIKIFKENNNLNLIHEGSYQKNQVDGLKVTQKQERCG